MKRLNTHTQTHKSKGSFLLNKQWSDSRKSKFKIKNFISPSWKPLALFLFAFIYSFTLSASKPSLSGGFAQKMADQLTRQLEYKMYVESGGMLMAAAIGDRVWEDIDQNGIQNPGEPGIDSVVVNLYFCNDLSSPIATTKTANGGMYQFMGLVPGDYVVEFESVTGLIRSPQDASINDQIDSDAGPDGFTDCITVGTDQIFNLIDAGYYNCVPSGTLVCNDFVTIALDQDCTESVNADLLLNGEDGCSDLFLVELFFNGVPIGNIITSDYVGEELLAVVTNPVTLNFCESTIMVVDNLAPTIEDCDDVTVSCTSSLEPAEIGQPVAFDNCSDIVSLLFSDADGQTGECSDPFVETIIRTWTAIDASGNSETCEQIITIARPAVNDVVIPEDLIEENNNSLDCENPDTDPSNTGVPTIDGVEITSGDLCNIDFTYTDVVIPTGPNTFEVIRTWIILDGCTGQKIEEDQIIQVIDTEGPELTCPSDISVGSGLDCVADVILPEVIYTDNCSPFEEITVVTETPFGMIMGNGGFLSGLPAGNNEIIYVVTDAYGNTSSCSINLSVADDEPPVAICDEQTSIGIGANGTATVCWPTFDDGSTDNCGIVAYKVKRADEPFTTPFTDCVQFDCADVGQTIGVRLRVYDVTGNFSEDDPNGRWNECLVQVSVQDNIQPTVVCPSSKTLGCLEFDPNVWDGVVQDPTAGPPVFELPSNELIGYYENAFDNCSNDNVVVNVSQSGGPDQCGEGTVTRVYTVIDAQGGTNSCVQIITLQNNANFTITDTDCWASPVGPNHSLTDGVEWPCDLILSTCGAGLSPEELEANPAVNINDVRPQVFEDACDLVGVTYEDTEFPIGVSACVKLVRKWTIVDWCQPDPSFPLGYVSAHYIQEIKVLESQAPTISSTCEDITVCGYEANCGPIPVELSINATDDCTAEPDLIYYYKIDAFNDGSYDVNSDSNPFADSGNSGNEANGSYPAGTHKIQWRVEDGCGNIALCDYLFTLEDCAPPEMECKLLSASLGLDGEVQIHANSFENGSSQDNCTPFSQLYFSYSSDVNDTVRVFSCDDLGASPVDITIYGTDEDGNQAFCSTTLDLQDPLNACSGNTVAVSGMIVTENDAPINKVDVTVSKTNGAVSPLTTNTQLDGIFDFNLNVGENYTVEPEKKTGPLNGVTTFDLVLISQHILGVESLDSPYKIIAADASNDGKVTTFDIVELRKLILHINDELPNNDSWRFVDQSYAFPNENDPFTPPFPEVINFNDLEEEQLFTDFVGVKIGDVDGNVNSSELDNGDDRSFDREITFQVNNETFVEGDLLELNFRSSDFQRVKGFQFTLDFDEHALEFLDLQTQAEGMGEGNFGMTQLDKGILTCSWNGEGIENKSDVFTLTFLARKAGQLSDLLSINSSYTPAEAYLFKAESNAYHRAEVLLQFIGNQEEVIAGGRYELYQNQPNPFNNTTQIGFYLPKTTDATLRIFDASGRMLKQIKGEYGQGYNSIVIDGAELGEHGLMYYQLETNEFTDTKKMIFVR
jgi:hypothetical protein